MTSDVIAVYNASSAMTLIFIKSHIYTSVAAASSGVSEYLSALQSLPCNILIGKRISIYKYRISSLDSVLHCCTTFIRNIGLNLTMTISPPSNNFQIFIVSAWNNHWRSIVLNWWFSLSNKSLPLRSAYINYLIAIDLHIVNGYIISIHLLLTLSWWV